MVKRGQSCPRLRPRQFGYPLSFRGQVRGAQSLLPCFPATALLPWRPPSLARVPVSPVPRGQRHYEGATTSRLRMPGRLSVSLSGVRATLRSSCSPWRRSRMVGGPVRARALGQPAAQLPAHSHADAGGISQVPRRSIPYLCPGPRPRPDRRSLTLTVSSMLPPLNPQRRLQRSLFRGYSRGFGICCLRFTTGVAARRARLASGWLADLYREGVEPSGSRRKVSELHVHPPLLSFSCRKDRQRQAGRADLAARGAEGSCQTIQARSHLACGRVLHPAARRAAQPCLVL